MYSLVTGAHYQYHASRDVRLEMKHQVHVYDTP